MPALDAEVFRKGRPVEGAGARFKLDGRPDDIALFESKLRGWLTAGKWSPGLWGQFELRVREAGRSRVAATVRV